MKNTGTSLTVAEAARTAVGSVRYRLQHLISREGLLTFVFNGPQYFSLKLKREHVYRIFARTTEGEPPPRVPTDTECRIVRSIGELDEITASKLEVGYLRTRYVRQALARDVVLVCLFVGGKLAHTTWIVIGPGARLDPFAPRVDYRQAAYICDCYTRPAFRGRRLYPYALTQAAFISEQMGFSRNVLVVPEVNIPSLVAVRHAGFCECGEVRLRRSFTGPQHTITCSVSGLWLEGNAALAPPRTYSARKCPA